MKRLHVNMAVTDLAESIRFYTALFAAAPTVQKSDYAKWMLEDPRVNFAITTRGSRKGIDHLGIQVEDEAELQEVHDRLVTAGGPRLDEGETTCCYARSEKSWIFDPEGVAWETFLTKGESPVYGGDVDLAVIREAKAEPSACCTPKPNPAPKSSCC